jgi:hypothetical protein
MKDRIGLGAAIQFSALLLAVAAVCLGTLRLGKSAEAV